MNVKECDKKPSLHLLHLIIRPITYQCNIIKCQQSIQYHYEHAENCLIRIATQWVQCTF